MDHTSRSSENSSAECDLMNWGTGLFQEVSEEKAFSILPRYHSCGILVKEWAAFCLCQKSLPKAEVKNFGFIPLAEGISKQLNTESAVWFLVVTLIAIGHASGAGCNWSSRGQASRRKSSLDQSHLGKVQGLQTLECHSFLLCLYVCHSSLSLVFSIVWVGVGRSPLPVI